MTIELTMEDKQWIKEQIDIGLASTPKQRLDYVASMQDLCRKAWTQKGITIDPELEARATEAVDRRYALQATPH